MSGIKRNPRVRLELSERAYSDRRNLARPVKLFSVVAVSLCVLWLSAARAEPFNPYKPVTLIAFMCEGIACTM